MEDLNLFPKNYPESRQYFRARLDRIGPGWPGARLESHVIDAEEDLSIDWISAPARELAERLVILSTGEHGIEGYVGAAMLRLFIHEYLGRIDPSTTGLLLVHAMNPWGMQHRRRVNQHNVDLNRNFLEPKNPDQPLNPDYRRLEGFLNPQRPIAPSAGLTFSTGLLGALLQLGPQRLKAATLLGQFQNARGIYYSGNRLQEETRCMISLLREHIQPYPQIIHLDMHSGYGPRYQMSLVNSSLEPIDSNTCREKFAYPLVLKNNTAEFYAIRGDMIDYVYRIVQEEFPRKRLFATAFEFGTFGNSVPASLRSLRVMIQENQLHWHGALTPALGQRVQAGFQELFAPSETRWRQKALADARQAFEGILSAEGYLRAQ